MDSYKIGEVSKIVGLPAKTIRFYEESGVISNVRRSQNRYRSYTKSTIEELKLLKYARDLGLPLSEIKKLMKGCDNGDCEHSKEYLESTINNYLKLLKNKIEKLNLLKNKLEEFEKQLSEDKNFDKNTYCCDILHQLNSFSEKGGEKNA